MSKPEDIPQDVWNVAEAKAIDYLNWFGAALKSDDQYVLAQTIARAILAAKAEAEAERDLLQEIIDGRPAINAALPDSYVRWSQSIYSGEAVRAAIGKRGVN